MGKAQLNKHRVTREDVPAAGAPLEAAFFHNRLLEIMDGYVWYSVRSQVEEAVYYSPSIRKITGFSDKEISDFSGRIFSIIEQADIAPVLKAHNELSASRRSSAELTYRIRRKDGTLRWLRENITAVYETATQARVLYGVVCDVTELKDNEEKSRLSETAFREALEAKDRFINILSHDLRAPFTSILGFSEILLNEPNLPQQDKTEYLTYIYEASQSQLQFISYLLDWSRLKTGSLKIEPVRLRLQALVYNAVSMLTGNAIRKNIDIHVDVTDSIYVQADERLLNQVILNLCSNAVKFSFENGSIDITANLFNESQVEIVVKDNGTGITQEDQQKIFGLEKTFSKEGTKGEKGSGFGLALVKEIVEKHGGEIWFYSEEGRGTEFHFTMPLPSNAIVIVENSEAERAELETIIRSHFPDFMLYAAENGYEAIAMVSDKHPNLIITGHDLPLMNGLQLVESMRKGESALKQLVLVIGNDMSPEVEGKYLRMGVSAVFQRPFDEEEFVQFIQQILN